MNQNSGSISSSISVTPQRQIPAEIEAMHRALKTLEDRVGLLLDRVSTVRFQGPAAPAGMGNPSPSVPLCTFANEIRSFRNAVEEVTARVDEAISELEL